MQPISFRQQPIRVFYFCAILCLLTASLQPVPAVQAQASQQTTWNLISDGQFVFGPNVGWNFLPDYTSQSAPQLQPYAKSLNGHADLYSINPKVYLALMEMTTGLVSNRQASQEQLEKPFGFSDAGFLKQVEKVSTAMFDAYYLHLYQFAPLSVNQRQLPGFVLKDGSNFEVPASTNSGTYAILAGLALLRDSAGMQVALDGSDPQSFVQTYQSLFPGDDPLSTANQVFTPGDLQTLAPPAGFLQFPFPRGESWAPNGVHNGAGGSVGDPATDMSAIDFSPGWPAWGGDTSNMWVVAAASGTPSKTSNCGVKITHSDGWSTSYYHLDNIQTFGSTINQNDHIAIIANNFAQATCVGGYSTGPHVHFTLKYNGAYYAINGTALSGWVIHSGRNNYDTDHAYMWLERGGVKKYAYTAILNDYGTCPQSSGVILYWNPNYNCSNTTGDAGYRQRTTTGFQNINDGQFNDKASSVKIPSGWSVRLYASVDHGEPSVCYSSDVSDFGTKGNFPGYSAPVNDNVSSMEVFNDSNCGGTGSSTVWTGNYYDSTDRWSDITNSNNFRCTETLNMAFLDQSYSSGAPCGMDGDTWVGDYTATVNFPAGNYVLFGNHDDGMRVLLNGQKIAEWNSSESDKICPPQSLSGNTDLRAMLREDSGDAKIKLWWETDTGQCNPPAPGSFGKSSPGNGSTAIPSNTSLSWTASSNATSYDYCIDTINNGSCDTQWTNVVNATSAAPEGLGTSPTYYWQVRAINITGTTYANNNTWWSFTLGCYTLSINALPTSTGQVAVSPSPNCNNGTQYSSGTVVKLTAKSFTGYNFLNWSGDASGSTNPVSVTMNASRILTAYFTPRCYTLTIVPTTRGTIAADPSPNCPSGSGYAYNTVIQLTASPVAGYGFSGWSGSVTGASNPVSVTMSSNRSATANFSTCYTLTTTANYSGRGTVSANPAPNCNGGTQYTSGTVVHLTASPATGYSFLSWSGSIASTSNPASVTMTANRSIIANFLNCYTLTITANNSSRGTVSANPTPNCNGGTQYTSGTVVQLTASPAAGYSFSSWSGSIASTSNPVSVTMSMNRSITANFSTCYTLTTAANSSSRGTIGASPAPNCNSGMQYTAGTVVQLTASPATGYSFLSWSGSIASTSNPVSVKMSANRSITANFSSAPP